MVVHRSSGELRTLDRGVQLAVYRIVQEALTNALKHGGPGTRVDLAVGVEEALLHIDVHDTGPGNGSVRSRPQDGEGHGIPGMRERAALYDGTVVAGPGPDGGWTLRATLDLTPPAGTDLAPPAVTGGAA